MTHSTCIDFLSVNPTTGNLLVGVGACVWVCNGLLVPLRLLFTPSDLTAGCFTGWGGKLLVADVNGRCLVHYLDGEVETQVEYLWQSPVTALKYECCDMMESGIPLYEFTMVGYQSGRCDSYSECLTGVLESSMVPRNSPVVGCSMCLDASLPLNLCRFWTAGFRDGQFRTMFAANRDADFGGFVGGDAEMTCFAVPFNGKICYGGFQSGRVWRVAQFEGDPYPPQPHRVSASPITCLALYENDED